MGTGEKVTAGCSCCGLRGHWPGTPHQRQTFQGVESKDGIVSCLGTRDSRRGHSNLAISFLGYCPQPTDDVSFFPVNSRDRMTVSN